MTLPIPCSNLCVPLNPYVHRTFSLSKHPMQITKTSGRASASWTDTLLLASYHSIPMVWSGHKHHFQGQHIYRVTIGNIPQCMDPNFTKTVIRNFGKKWKWVYCSYTMCSNFYAMWILRMTSPSMLQRLVTMRCC